MTTHEMDYTLKEILPTVTKYELDKIRKFADIKGVSKLNKPKLIEVLVEEQQLLFDRAMQMMDRVRFDELNRMAKIGYMEYAHSNKLRIGWYMKTSLAFPSTYEGKQVVVMPIEYRSRILEAEQNLDAQRIIKENDELIFVTKGLLETLGVLRWTELYEKLEALGMISQRLQGSTITKLITEFNAFEDYFEVTDKWISDLMVDDPEEMLKGIDARPSIQPVDVTKEQLLELGKRGELAKTKEFERFEKYLVKAFRVAKEDAQDLLALTVIDIRNELTFHEVMQNLVESFEFSSKTEAAEFTSYVTKLANSTPRWLLKGHAPNDISRSEPVAAAAPVTKAVGRNEPCPCGSEKKYKKCCGK